MKLSRPLALVKILILVGAACALFGIDAPEVQAGVIVNAPTYLGLHNGLVGFWSFDGKSVAGVHAYDMSGNGNRGTLTNGPVRTAGKIGQALEFDGGMIM